VSLFGLATMSDANAPILMIMASHTNWN
jgi:hypothetical protein